MHTSLYTDFRSSNFCSGDMFSCLIPGLNSINSPEDELPGQFPASFRSFLNLSGPCVTFFRLELSDSSEFRTLVVAAVIVIVIVMAGSLLWSLFPKERKVRGSSVAPVITEAAGELPEVDAVSWPWILLNDARFHEDKGELIPVSDVINEEDLQVQEALFASLLTSQMANNASSSAIQATPTINSKLVKIAKEVTKPAQSFCEICMENRESWQMFRNETCPHSFCYDCTSRHIIAKIQDNVIIVTCPGVNCNARLDSGACRLMIPEEVLIRWDESLCQSLVLESQKVYCPFRDCSAMMVHDSGEIIKEAKCPVCGRLFCAQCCVPWHSEFTCKEFQKLNGKKIGGKDLLVEKLAEKKKWRKCSRCKFYVEKTEGCLHITCRCAYEFCYSCGSKWSHEHGACRAKDHV